jgi:hypothetical protein
MSVPRTRSIASLFFGVLAAVVVHAQPGKPTEAEVNARRLQSAQDPALGATDVGTEQQLTIEASADDTKGKFRIGSKNPPSTAAQHSVWSLVMEAKIDNGDKTAVLGDLDGLNDDFAATYTHAFLLWKPAVGTTENALRQALCRRNSEDQNEPYVPTAICNPAALDGPNAAEYRREWDEAIHRARPIRRLSLAAKAGYSKFDYLDAASVEATSDRKVGFSFSGTYSVLAPDGSVPFAGMRLERSYKSASSIELCEAGPVANSSTCETKAFGAPSATERIVLFGEWRKFYRRFAVSPRLSYETRDSRTGFRVPFWFIANDAGRFSGGVRLDWNNQDDDATVSVFVSTPLSLLTN